MEVCKFCNQNEAIENSHVIPKAIYDWLKKTAPSPYIRSVHNPTQRVQDGLKSALLCNDCEVNFSKIEDDFNRGFFTKVANYRKPCPKLLPITSNVLKCFYVIAWRVLADSYYFPKENDYTDAEFKEFPVFLDKIKAAIDSDNLTDFRVHLIPCEKSVLVRIGLPKVEWHIYERSITAEPRIWNNWERFLIYIQIPFSIIVFEIVKNETDEWSGTLLEKEKSLDLSKISSVPDYVGDLIGLKYQEFESSKLQLTKSQIDTLNIVGSNMDENCGAWKTMSKRW